MQTEPTRLFRVGWRVMNDSPPARYGCLAARTWEPSRLAALSLVDFGDPLLPSLPQPALDASFRLDSQRHNDLFDQTYSNYINALRG